MVITRKFATLIFSLLIFASAWAQSIEVTIDSLKAHLKANISPAQRIETLILLTKAAKNIYPDQAVDYAKMAYTLALREHSTNQEVRAMIEIGWIMMTRTMLDSSLRITLKAKQLAEESQMDKEAGMAVLIIGINHNYMGDFKNCLSDFYSAFTIFQRLDDKEGMILSLNSLGSFCYQQGNDDKAIIYFNKSLAMARKLNRSDLIANVQNNIALIHVNRNEIGPAIDCYNEAIERNQASGQIFRLALNYMNLANIYLNEKQYDRFMNYYNKATDIFRKTGSIYQLSVCYMNMGEYYLKRNMPDSAILYTMKAFKTGMDRKMKEIITNSATQLEQIYKLQKKTDSAYKYASIRFQYKDSLAREMNSSRLAQLEIQNQYENSIKEEKLRQQKKDFYITIIAILIISGLIISFLFLSRQIVKTKNIRLEKQNLAIDLEFKNKELAINVMNLLKKNEFLVDHTNKLIEIQKMATEENIKTGMLKLIGSLQRDSGERTWDEFEMRFKQVHTGFYERLLKTFPELTSNELKLCALLRLNLSTKEICELTGQQHASLDVARSRLRKRLGITSSQTNLVTFLTQV
ncbi:MAG: tetratricopeptide repeat protein [Bacteroidetes bacterium]|nr:tetratricopeptide repeat protein [Bacteroidota bacterium]